MIDKIRHSGLRRLYRRGDRSKLSAQHVDKIEDMLAVLDIAQIPEDVDVQGWGLHALTGKWEGFWAIEVSKNQRIWFTFEGEHVTEVHFGDYHTGRPKGRR